MTTIVALPGMAERSWTEFEKLVRIQGWRMAMPKADVDWVLADLEPRFFALPLDGSFQIDRPYRCIGAIDAVLSKMREINRELLTEVLNQMFRLECELWLAKFGREPTP
jgi:hypothetical protein